MNNLSLEYLIHSHLKKKSAVLVFLMTFLLLPVFAIAQNTDGCFELADSGEPVPLVISHNDHEGAILALQNFGDDVERVTHAKPDLFTASIPEAEKIVLAGTIGKSPFIDQLIEKGKIDVKEIEGEWEAYLQQVVENPFPGVEQALVIAGSDKRGAIYGIYDLSEQIGVSPWYWWADVPVPHQSDLTVLPECSSVDKPAVQYRGIFLNNENPSLLGWVNETYGGFNHEFYSDVFELLLRQKGNYLWSAMWGKAFYDDDPLNAETADKYGVVMGTSHHEPMARAHVEWERYGEGDWNYQTNKEELQEFWREGIERLNDYEATISLAMRGDGDEPMSDEADIELLQQIVKDQREIIDEISPDNKDRQIQLWALYKEVQEYYERGMRVPDDVMLLLANDNWGNVRLLPEPGTAEEHPGGWGMYYHFDYVGGPRNYKWINTIQISRIWEQMNLTYQHGVEKMWLVNVGDLKPMEYPISFFLNFAWAPDSMTIDKMNDYPQKWAKNQFGNQYAGKIGEILTTYTQYNSRRKPELLSPETYSLFNFNEAGRVVEDYNQLVKKAEGINNQIPEEYKDAYYQLVLFPVTASANLNELYVTTAKNRWYAEQGRAKTNEMADKVESLFKKDAELTGYYNTRMSDGKWNHMMDQTHIGYTYWQQPEENAMPEVKTIELPETAEMGVAIEGSESWWPDSQEEAVLPQFDSFNKQTRFIEIFNRGQESFDFTIETDANWLTFSETEGDIDQQKRIKVNVNWEQLPEGNHRGSIIIEGTNGSSVEVLVEVFNPASSQKENIKGFVEANGYVSMEAEHFTKSVKSDSAEWLKIPQLGKTLSAMTPMPVTAENITPGFEDSPRLEYAMHLINSGEVRVKVYLSPTLDYYMNHEGLKYGVSFNDEEPQIINIHENYNWDDLVANNINIKESTHTIENPGQHVLKIWMVDPGVVIQKIVVETEDSKESYLGPPESFKAH
ncbi:MAG: glycosyl hydrolase 115 family protein [Balneolaceae bacterium]